MMFENMPASNFNPMRDVWFPLDLSNPASFNAIMAHSAAHLAHYYGAMTPTRGTNSSEALKFKADAVQILNHWLSDPEKALSNDAFAAVVRLLTFEVSHYSCLSLCYQLASMGTPITVSRIEVLGHRRRMGDSPEWPPRDDSC